MIKSFSGQVVADSSFWRALDLITWSRVQSSHGARAVSLSKALHTTCLVLVKPRKLS